MNVKGAMFQGKQAEVILTKAIITIEVLKSFFFFQIVEKMPQYSPMPPSMERSILNEGYTKSDLGWQWDVL
jgi:hypothetical protein